MNACIVEKIFSDCELGNSDSVKMMSKFVCNQNGFWGWTEVVRQLISDEDVVRVQELLMSSEEWMNSAHMLCSNPYKTLSVAQKIDIFEFLTEI